MKNFKKMVFGLLVAVLAVGFSAFTSIQTKVPSWVYVQTGSDQYDKIPFTEYSQGNCEDQSEKPCSFIQDETDMSDHGNTLTEAQARAIATLDESPLQGLYVAP